MRIRLPLAVAFAAAACAALPASVFAVPCDGDFSTPNGHGYNVEGSGEINGYMPYFDTDTFDGYGFLYLRFADAQNGVTGYRQYTLDRPDDGSAPDEGTGGTDDGCGFDDDGFAQTFPPNDELDDDRDAQDADADSDTNEFLLRRDLVVTRNVHFSQSSESFVRFLDSFTNTGSTPVTFDYAFEGNLESDSSTEVLRTSSGDRFFDSDDFWGVTHEPPTSSSGLPESPDVGINAHYDGPGVADRPERFRRASHGDTTVDDTEDFHSVEYHAITLQAGQTATYMHLVTAYAVEEDSVGDTAYLSTEPSVVLAGMDAAERASLRNWRPGGGDADGDGHGDDADNCAGAANADQADLDGDGAGDVCDSDVDDDGLPDSAEGGLGTDPRHADTDRDGRPDGVDRCPTRAGPGDGCPATTTTITTTTAPAPAPIPVGSAVTLGRLLPSALTLDVAKRRAGRALRLTSRGRVELPAGITAAEACRGGVVAVQIKSGRRTVSTRMADLRPDCTYRTAVSFRSRRRLGRRVLTARARFVGNERLERLNSDRVRIGRP